MAHPARPAILRRVLALAAVALLVGLSAACSGDDEPDEPTGTTIGRVGAVGPALRFAAVSLDSLDPAYVTPTDQAEMIAIDLLFDGLTAFDPETGAAVASLASAWEANDGLTEWTFTLDERSFHDGEPVTAADVKFSYERLAALGGLSLSGVRLDIVEGWEAFAAGEADEIAGIEAVDDTTVRITVTEAYAPMPELLSSPLYGIVPAHDAAERADFIETPVGSGPFELVARDDERLVLEPAAGAPVELDGAIELVLFDDLAAGYEAFEAGEVDWALVPRAEAADAAETYGDAAMVPFHTEVFFGINLADERFAELRFRQAIARAIDTEALLDGPLASSLELRGAVPAGVPGAAADACGPACTYDPDMARALLEAAFGDGPVPAIELQHYDDPVDQAIAEAVTEDLTAVGIPVTPVELPFAEYRSFVVSGGQQLFTFGWVGVAIDADTYLSPLFGSESLDNVTGFADATVDLALKVARAEADRNARVALYADIDEAVMANVPIVPLATFVTNAVISERVGGYVPRTDGTFVAGALRIAG